MLGNKQPSSYGNKLGNKQTNPHNFGNKYLNSSSSNKGLIHHQIQQNKPFQSPLEKNHPMWKNMHS
jgi:hypothetical protein